MAEQIAEGRGADLAYDGDDAALVEALAQAADDLPNLKAQAAGIMEGWRTWDGRALTGIALDWCAGRSLDDFKRGSSAPDQSPPGASHVTGSPARQMLE
jgi:hypothetical protein